MFHYAAYQWVLAGAGAFLIGLSKTGIAGIGLLGVVVFALAFPAKVSVGIVLPILLCADVIAITAYRKHVVWSHLAKLFPWAAVGVVLGYLAMGKIDDIAVSHGIGVIAIALSALQVWRKHVATVSPEKADHVPNQWWFAALMGVTAGFTTMVANAAGPVMVLYLLAAGLLKMEFVGTNAWYFFIVNSFKVPFSWHLGLINTHSLPLDLIFGPVAIVGALTGRAIIKYIKQSVFENLALVLTVLAGLKLLLAGVLPGVK